MKSSHKNQNVRLQDDPLQSESAASSIRSLQSSWSGWDYTDIGYEFTGDEDSKSIPKLVDYSIAGETADSSVQVQDVINSTCDSTKITSSKKQFSHSSSLDDLYSLKQREQFRGQSLYSLIDGRKTFGSWLKSEKENHSSSSTITLIPRENFTFKMLQIASRKHKYKRVPKEKFEHLSNTRKEGDNFCLLSNCLSEGCPTLGNDEQSHEGSLNDASFEYISGSAYNEQVSNNEARCDSNVSSISVQSTTREVTDGVDLVIQYVNNLSITDKRKVIKKVAESLLNNANEAHGSRSSPAAQFERLVNDCDLLSTHKPKSTLCFRSAAKASSATMGFPSLTSDKLKICSSNSLLSSSLHSSCKLVSSSTDSYKSLETSRQTTSSIGIDNYGSSTTATEHDIRCRLQNQHSSISTNDYPKSLKDCLLKERETQLLWIKSNIRHLKNLKKLCENQKMLRKELNLLNTTTANTGKLLPMAESNHLNYEQKQKSSNRRGKFIDDNFLISEHHNSYKTDTSDEKMSINNRTKEKHKKTDRDIDTDSSLLCSKKRYRNALIENKENTLRNILKKVPLSKRHSPSKCTYKPAVKYSIFFQKKAIFPYNVNFEVSERSNIDTGKRRTSEKRTEKTFSRKKVERVDYVNMEQSFTLQEYLLRNRPDYINRAEYRRRCLAAATRSRLLKDENREELLIVSQSLNKFDSNLIIGNTAPSHNVIPKIFDEKLMKKETKKKYLQLPEVRNKEAERKKKMNYSRNHLRAKIFAKRLQKKVLKGQVELSNHVTLVGC